MSGDDPAAPAGPGAPEDRPGARPLSTSAGRRRANQLGGRRRAESLTPERRSEIARRAALSRWGRREGRPGQGGEPEAN